MLIGPALGSTSIPMYFGLGYQAEKTQSDNDFYAGTVGGDFFIGFITGYVIKKVIKLAAVIVGLFIATLAFLEYQRILSVDWHKIQALSQNGIEAG